MLIVNGNTVWNTSNVQCIAEVHKIGFRQPRATQVENKI